jgi:ABC-type polysaccharide/polyol phosphate transport system ATPase subunit
VTGGPLIEASGLGVRFQFDRLQRVVTPLAARLRRRGYSVWGLHDVDLSVSGGTSLALVGPSGSGKTTLLRVLAGVLAADAGSLRVASPVGALLATDAGLLPTLTGRENAALLAPLHGIPRHEVAGSIERAIAFSELGDSFDRPVSAWSQGMKARLGLAVAISGRPRVLLLDEVHEALDSDFRARLHDVVGEVLGRGGVVVAAGHDLTLLADLCGEAALLGAGTVRLRGTFGMVAGERDLEPA